MGILETISPVALQEDVVQRLDEKTRAEIDAALDNPNTREAVEKMFCDYAAQIPSIEAQGVAAEVDAIRDSVVGALIELFEGEGAVEDAMRGQMGFACEIARNSPQR